MASSSSSPPPSFFKIVLSPVTEGIKIPTAFMRNFGHELKEVVVLKVPNGASWRVQLLRMGDGTWLDKGWEEFAAYYGIKLHHFLLFRYDGDSQFHVVIFDKSATEIYYRVEEEEDDDVPEDEDVETEEEDDDDDEETEEDDVSADDEHVRREGTRNSRERGGLSYSFTMKKTHLIRLTFPNFYARQAGLCVHQKVSLIYPSISERKHSVRLFQSTDGRLFTGQGWTRFRRLSNLRKGRKYRVTLVWDQNGNPVFKFERD